jgi:hypothetical protein
MSRQLLSRANQVFFGRASIGNYQSGKPGGEITLQYRFKPVGNRAVTFSAAPAAGATSATLSANWGGASGIWPITFSDGEVLNGIFTNGATTCTFLPASFPQVASATLGPYGGSGALVNAVTTAATVGGQPPVVGVANSILTSSSINTGTPVVPNGALATSGVATTDVARNIVAAWTGTAVLTVTGTDMYGYAQTESSASGTSFTGKKAFATITSIAVSANVTACTVGTGNALGLPFKCISGDVFAFMFNDAVDASTFVKADVTYPATSTTGDVRGTLTPAGTLNGSSFYSVLLKPKDASTQVDLFGVPPA